MFVDVPSFTATMSLSSEGPTAKGLGPKLRSRVVQWPWALGFLCQRAHSPPSLARDRRSKASQVHPLDARRPRSQRTSFLPMSGNRPNRARDPIRSGVKMSDRFSTSAICVPALA